jgi:cyclophilin family peptidyl-prolyl cis-trans isomerase
MLIRDFLKTLVNRRKSDVRRRLSRPHDLSEQLESRTLLTGNVQVSLSGANAQITGDAANNEFEVVLDNGSVVVRGLNGTTINQATDAFTLVSGATTFSGSLNVSLGAGDDIATIGPGITFSGNVSVSGDAGADTLRALTGTYNGNLSLAGGDGTSSLVVDGATVGGNLSVTGNGVTVASITNSTVHGRLDAWTGFGNSPDSVVIKGSTVDRLTKIITGSGDDNVVIQNSHLNGQLFIFTGVGNDVVYIDSSSVGKLALIATQRGDDTLQVLHSSSFSRLMIFAGGLGHDGASIAADTSTRGVIQGSQKAQYFSAATVASRITDSTTGAIAVADNLLTAAVPNLTVSTSVATFAENSGASAATLTVTRTGPTTADQVLTLTSSDTTKATVPATITILAGSTSATATISAVDNTTIDGALSVTFTVAAAGFSNATAVVTVTDNETALSMSASPALFSEAAGATASTLTVTRTGPTTADQIVNLLSSNALKATVPATVTILAGNTTATVNVAAVDNPTADGNFTVTFTAAATGFANATTDVTVTDSEATLSVSANPAIFSENAGTNASTLTVTRTGLTTEAQIVTLTSSNILKAIVPTTVTIPAGSTTATAIVAAVDNQTVDGAAMVTITATATGIASGTATLTVNDNETALTLSASPITVSESAGSSASTLTVTRTGPTTVAQVVTLSSSNESAATVPTTVTIPVGATTATVNVEAVNNPAVTGPVNVTFTAVAAGFADATTTLTVTDNQTVLTLSANPATIAENAGASASTLTVTRSGPTTSELLVSLSSSNNSHADVPATVIIPLGSTTATVLIAAIDDNIVNADATVTIIASATGFSDVTTNITVTNTDVATLTMTSNAADVSENAGTDAVEYTVRRNTSDNTLALAVNLSSDLTSRLTVPATVTIPAGTESVTFSGSPVDDSQVNGNSPVIVTASATGFASGSSTVTVKDNDAGTLALTSSSPDVAENAGTGALTFTITRTSTDTTQPLVLTLSSSNPSRLTVANTVTIDANQTSATFTGSPVSDLLVGGDIGVVVTAVALGFADATSTVTINNTDVPTLTIATNSPTVAENGAMDALVYTVSRNTSDNSSALTVTLASSVPSRLADVGAIVIPANQSSVTFNGTPVDNGVADGNADVVVTVSAAGFVNDTATVTVVDDEPAILSVTANQASVFETAGASAVTYTVSRNTINNSQPLVVNLASGTPSRMEVAGTVTIPAGASSVTFVGAAVDNTVVDGDASVVVTASATGFTNGTASVTVKDNDAGIFTVTPNTPTVSEGAAAGTLTYTVARASTDTTQPLTVNLLSDTPDRLTVVGTVTILANETTAIFDGSVLDNSLVDGNVDVIVTASASGFSNATGSVTVNDNDVPALTVTPTTSAISENYAPGTFFYTVARNSSDLTEPLTVNLTSGNTTRLGVPATITLRAGSAFEAFQVTPVNNNIADGNVDVTLTANATGFAEASWTVNVIDDETATPPPFLTATLTVASLAESSPAESTQLTVTRTDSDTTNPLVVNLTYSDTSRVSGPATITIPATATSASVLLSTIDNLIVDGNIDEDISATAVGFESSQTTLRIIDNEIATLSVTTAVSTVAEDSGTLAGTVVTSLASSAPIVVSLSYQSSNVLTGPSVVVIPAGATSVPVTFTINNGSVTDQNIVAGIVTAAFGTVSGEALVTVTDADSMSLTATANATDAVQSNGTIITRNAVAQVTGTTTAGASITVDSDGDGLFDNGTATAGSDGTYTVDVNVTNTSTNHGENRIVVRAVDGPNSADTGLSVHRAVGTVVHFATNVGAYDVEMLDAEADSTVVNFLSYITSGAYQNTFVHRANSGSQEFIQSGSFKVTNSQITSVATTGTINGQFNAVNGNVAGTLAMALTSAGPDSGTSGWFINSIDNSAAFDPGQYTVFGRVIGDGLTVVQQISDLSKVNLNTLYSSSALATVPLTGFAPENTLMTGVVSTTLGSAVLTGTGTLFTSELVVGDSIVIGGGKAFFVSSIESDTSLTLTQSVTTSSNGLIVRRDVAPTDAEFVVFSSIGKILDTL